MKHFVIDATPYDPNNITGAGRIVYHLVANLAALDRDNHFHIFGLVPAIWPEKELPENFTYQQIHPTRLLGPLSLEVARRNFIGKRLSNFHTDVLHLTLDMVPVYDEHARTLFSLYDLARLSPHFIYSVEQNLRTFLRTQLRYRLAKKADLLHTISNYSAEAIIDRLKIDRRRVRVIYPGYDPLFAPGPADDRVLQKHRLADLRFLLFVGEFGRQKNEEGLIKAFRQARQERGLDPDIKLVMVGDANKLKPSTRAFLSHHEFTSDVIFPGHIPDRELLHLYRRAEALVLPSFYEGFGLPALEAMACGTVPVVSRVTSLPEVVGDAGLLVSPGNTQELAETICDLLNDRDKQAQLSKHAIERAKQFTFAAMTKATWETYLEMSDG